MKTQTFGIDFGTTNSLVAYVVDAGDGGKSIELVDPVSLRPHPSVVWYRGEEKIVGPEARAFLDAGGDAISGDFVRSPKRLLASDASVHVGGRSLDPADVVAEVLKFLKTNAAGGAQPQQVSRAVFSIPIDLDGPGRRRLRRAARQAGIDVVQFVHEPMAALYGYLRNQPDFWNRVTQMEGDRILVFDWGGGTLDLTLCLVRGGKLIQIASRGDNDVGGIQFDDAIRNLLRERHAKEHGLADLDGLESDDARIRLLTTCENAKIRLSGSDSARVITPRLLKEQPGRDLALELTRGDLDECVRYLVDRGLEQIDRLLADADLTLHDVSMCLPTGGVVNMPIVRNALLQRFGTRLKSLENGDRIIAAGAAWLAHDGARLTLAKPIELRQPDHSYTTVVPHDQWLPVEGRVISIDQRMYYCVDPRDGWAHFEFARPKRVGWGSSRSARLPYGTASLAVDPMAKPLVERIEAKIQIDSDYIVGIELRSTERGARTVLEIHDLEFALALPRPDDEEEQQAEETETGSSEPLIDQTIRGAVQLRTNVATSRDDWALVPGDIIADYQPGWFDVRLGNATQLQKDEWLYYAPCARCGRGTFKRLSEGCEIEGCDVGQDAAGRALREPSTGTGHEAEAKR